MDELPAMDELPKHQDPVIDAMAKLLMALPDLERLIKTGQLPRNLFWLQQLTVAGRRLLAAVP